jgi:RNA polymerase sigma-70 factor (ECF subfamily)
MIESTDEEIVLKVQSGDSEAFGVLVERYERRMHSYARKFLFGYEDSEDVVQTVFIKAYTNILQFDTKRKFSSWLYRVAHNEFINVIKKKGKENVSLFDVDTIFPHLAGKEDPFKDREAVELKNMLDLYLSKISPKYREILVLYYLEEMDYEEISEIMEIPSSTVGVRLKRGKDALKKQIPKNLYGNIE